MTIKNTHQFKLFAFFNFVYMDIQNIAFWEFETKNNLLTHTVFKSIK